MSKRQPGVSLTLFQKLTSGDRAIRRTWIRKLEYNILVPHELPDWTTRKSWGNIENYTTDNPIRKSNDLAFQTGVIDLFQILHSWDQRVRLRLRLGLRGSSLEPAPEPWTEYYQDAGEYRWDYKHGSRKSVPPYRAQFLTGMLAHVPPGAASSYLNRGSANYSATLSKCHRIGAKSRRVDPSGPPRVFTKATCSSLPSSLCVLDYEGERDGPWKPCMSALNLIPSGIDSLSDNLREFSTHLRELKFKSPPLPFDFLCPLDREGKPTRGGAFNGLISR
ncbi:hypothetical protein N7467_008002 [Penicillium canescens]|nr:hypothetical protein N7467_008002 [Penicillium canescens]